MVDNVFTASPATNDTAWATDDIAGVHHLRVKVRHGADGSATDVSTASPMPVDLRADNVGGAGLKVDLGADNDVVVSGTVTADAGTGPWPVTDNGGALTVDHATLDNAHSADFDTGVGVDTTPAFGLAVPASGGAAVVPGDAVAGLKVDLGADNDVTVTGSVTANAGTNLNTSALALEAGNLATIAGAVAGAEVQVDLVGITPDLMLGTDFSNVLGTASLILATQTDDLANTTDGVVTAALGYVFDGTTWDRLRGDATDGVLVNLGANNDVTVTGSVTANAGTNLNTSALALESGGNIATIAGAVSGNEMQVDVVTSALPTGAATAANQSTLITQTQPAQSKYRNIDANAESAIKASAGVLHWLHVMNLTAAKAYLHLYDATTATVEPGTTTPDFTFAIPTQGTTDGAGFNLPLGPNGQAFATAITLVCTTTQDGSAGDPGTNGVIVNAGYT